MELKAKMANLFAELGRSTLSVLPRLLDTRTRYLLSQAGYNDDQRAQIYTGLRLSWMLITFLLWIALSFGTLSLAESLCFPVFGLCLWMLPNFFLARIAKHHSNGTLYKVETYALMLVTFASAYSFASFSDGG